MVAASLSGPLGDRADAADRQLTVDLGQTGDEVMHGANGALYGLSDDGVPSDAMLEPLKITSISQKAQGGAQHPNGDAIDVSGSFFRNGGGDVYVMMQDIYPDWPYEDVGIADYLTKVEQIATGVAGADNSEGFVYVPFNEPDWIWYGLNSNDQAAYEAGRDRFFSEWKAVYERIRSIDPDARIAGPNEAYYDSRFLPEFLTWARDNDLLPDVMTWHELSADSLARFQPNYDDYRALEENLGIGPLPVNINEYANRRDASVPGQLVQWVSMLERNKVYGDQAYWSAAGSMTDIVVQNNQPNGGWWFYRWYAGMTGRTAEVTPPRANTVDTLQGMASLDTDKRQAQAIVGGEGGDTDVVIENIDPETFGTEVVATVSEAAWTGYDGASAAPRTLARTRLAVGADGSVTVPLTDTDKMSAYRVVLTPAGEGEPQAADPAHRASYEAEDASVSGGTVRSTGLASDANTYSASGNRYVDELGSAGSGVEFDVEVPEDGTYDLAILYGNGSGTPATQSLRVDGGQAQPVTYRSTLSPTYFGTEHISLELTAGSHTISLAHGSGTMSLDRIDLTAGTHAADASYEATLAETTGSPAYDYGDTSGTGTGALALEGDAGAVFDVYAPRDGYYTLTPRADSGTVSLSVHGETLAAGAGEGQRVYLVAGNNRVAATAAAGRVDLRSLDVSGTGDTEGVASYEGEDAALSGAATAEGSAFASGGGYAGWVGNGSANTAQFSVDAPSAGRYMLVVHYSNNERQGDHAYNANVVSRRAEIASAGGTQSVMFRNTWGWEDFWSQGVVVELPAGGSTITFANPEAEAYAPNIDRIELAPVTG